MLTNSDESKQAAHIGQGVVVQGVMKVPGSVQVDGTFSGELTAETLIVGQAGQVSGVISANRVEVLGKVEQQLNATHLLIRSTGAVTGSAAYSELEIERGGVMDGKISLEPRSHTPGSWVDAPPATL